MRSPQSEGKSIRTSNAIERLYEEFKRRIKTQIVPLHRNRRHVISGADRMEPDQHAESQWLTKPRRETQRSDYLPRRMIGYHHAARRWVKASRAICSNSTAPTG
jgi:hypothetical protein